MPLFLQIPHTVLRQSDTVFIHVMKKNGVLRATALSRARGKGEVWRGETSGLRTLSGFLPSKFWGSRVPPWNISMTKLKK